MENSNNNKTLEIIEAFNIAYSLFDMGQYYEAIKYYTKVIDLSDGTYYAAILNRGVSKLAISDNQGAIDDLKLYLFEALKQKDNYEMQSQLENVYVNLGHCYYELRQLEQSLEFYENAKKLNNYAEDVNHMIMKIHVELYKKNNKI
jgi:tetratricopeptide (TPR) repeat protein